MKNIAIVGGRVIDPKNQIDKIANVYINNGYIKAIDSTPPDDFNPDLVIDASKKLVCPGLVDLHATLLEGQNHIENFETQLKNAVSAGITHFATSAFTSRRCFEPAEITQFYHQAKAASLAKVCFVGALTQELMGNRLNELLLLKEAGCIGFSNGNKAIRNALVKRRCYDYAAMLNLKIFITPEDADLSQNGYMNEGKTSFRLGLAGIPSLAETIALATELLLVEETNIQAHFYKISTAKSIPILKDAMDKKLPVTSDATIAHLYLTDEAIQLDNGLCHVRPPFRSRQDLISLQEALKEGTLQAISSDHISLPKEAKAVPFQDSIPGIASWPLLLPLTLKLAEDESLSLLNAIKLITSNPAAILGIDAGHLSQGSKANLIIIDPDASWVISEAELRTFGMNNPFINYSLQGKLEYTLVEGRVVYRCH